MNRREFLTMLGVSAVVLALPKKYAGLDPLVAPSVYYAGGNRKYWHVECADLGSSLAEFFWDDGRRIWLFDRIQVISMKKTAFSFQVARGLHGEQILHWGLGPGGVLHWKVPLIDGVVFHKGDWIKLGWSVFGVKEIGSELLRL